MRISLVVAVSENGVIGIDNKLPWRIPEDLARFKSLTMGHTLLMGRKTFESIGRVLPGRTSIVLTRDRSYEPPPGVMVAHEVDEALSLAPGPEVFVVGGAEVYRLLMPFADRIHLTRVHGHYEGDTYFRGFDPEEWSLSSSDPGGGSAGAPSLSFEVYDREPRDSFRDV